MYSPTIVISFLNSSFFFNLGMRYLCPSNLTTARYRLETSTALDALVISKQVRLSKNGKAEGNVFQADGPAHRQITVFH